MSTLKRDRGILLEAGTNEVELLEFSIGKQHFATNVAKVKRILRWDPTLVTRLDMAPPSVSGSLLFMGHPILLINLRQVLEINAQPIHADRQLILVTEFNGIKNAFQIDSVNQIHRLSWKNLQPSQDIFAHNHPYTTGSVQMDDKVILVLDLEHIIAEISPRSSVYHAGDKIKGKEVKEARRHLKILFAEDSSMIRIMTIEHLRQSGFETIIAVENGLKAYEYLSQIKEKATLEKKSPRDYIDLVLTDIEMPQMDGLSLCKALKQDLGMGNVPLMIYSSLINDQMAKKCESVGANAYMSKPEIDQIVDTIDRLCLSPHP